jgi:hypothetical protein
VEQSDLTKFFPWIGNALDLLLCVSQRGIDTAIKDRVKDLFFAFEIKIDGAIRDSSLTRDISNLRIEVSIMSKHGYSRAQNRFALIASLWSNGRK